MEWAAIKLFLGPIFSGIGSFLSKSVTFFTTKPGVYILAGLLALGTVLKANDLGYEHGLGQARADEQLHIQQAVTLAAQEATKRQAALDKGAIAAAEKAGFLRGKAQAETVTIIKRIPVYVSAETDRNFPMPCGLYRLLNAAAARTTPEAIALPPGLVDADPCPIAASDIADHGVTIAGRYYEATAQIAGLQDLVKSLAAEIEQ